MTRTATCVSIAIACAAACARPAPERQIVDNAAAALGGAERILAVKTLSFDAEGEHFNLGQDMTPDAVSQTFSVRIRRDIDVEQRRARTEQTRTPNFAYFQGRAPQTRVMGIDGDIGYDVPANGSAVRIPEGAAGDRRAELYHHPLTIVRAALDPAARLGNPRTIDDESVVEVTTPDGLAFTLAIDSATGRPSRVVSMSAHPVLGDLAVETSFADYRDAGGLTLPTRLTTKADTFTTAEIRVNSQTVDADVEDLAAPAGLPAGGASGPPAVNVTVEEVARGVWLIAGQSHHSIAVEFADHLVLFEAPSEARTLAVIARARELRPGKPVTHVVNSHHHFDHAGGIRAAVAEGLTVVTHERNAALIEELVRRPHTMSPDALEKNRRPLTLEAVGDERVLQDGERTMHLFHIAGNPHGDALLMAWLPRERLLLQADAYSPAGSFHPFAANLLENIRKRNLPVERIVPVHGTVVPVAELVKAAQATRTN